MYRLNIKVHFDWHLKLLLDKWRLKSQRLHALTEQEVVNKTLVI